LFWSGILIVILLIVPQIEFPSILLPPSITSGSIVDITVAQNHQAEQKEQASFAALQEHILKKYGLAAPVPPNLRLRGATQTSLVLEWDPIQLATSSLRSLSLYRNNSKAGNIPRPLEMFSTKISGLAVDTEYSFHLVLRTSGGTYASNTLTVRTHKMTDLTGIVVTPGVLPQQLRESLEAAVRRIGGRMTDSVKIDTTHFVCTEGRGRDWERAAEMNIPVVRPEWVEGCEREGRIVGVRGYYLDANPKDRQVGVNPAMNAGNTPRASPAASVPSGAGTGAGSQSSLPSRGTPKSPMKDSPVIGEPGPEVPPTPPPKRDNEAPPTASADEDDDEEEDEEPAEKSVHKPATIKEDEESETRSSSHFHRRKSSAEDDEDRKGSAEMDEVPL
jgi:chitin biosynthesis protein CHS5